MAKFTLIVPDEYLPGLVAEFASLGSSEFTTPEEYLQASAVELMRQRCAQHKVGPYWEGPIPPQFNADGTPYTAPALDDNDTSTEAEATP